MGPSRQLALFLAVSVLGFVSSFKISHRSERNTDLAEALEILQRQRRRVGLDDFLNSERLLRGRPLTLDDVNDWLTRSNGNDVMANDDWLSETGSFKDFDPADAGYDITPPVDFQPTRIKASRNEVNDIFSQDDSSEKPDSGNYQSPDKKKKEEMVNVHGDKQPVTQQVGSAQDQTNKNDASDALNSLTDEEVRVLMKAVGKLQQRADEMTKAKKSDIMSEMNSEAIESSEMETLPNGNRVIISEPVSQEELKSVFTETNGPITKETTMFVNKAPGEDKPRVLEQEILSEKLPDNTALVRERELTNMLPQGIEDELEAEEEEEQIEQDARSEIAAEAAANAEAAVEEEEEEAAAEEQKQEETLAEAAEQAEAEQATEDAVAEEIANMDKDSLSPELVSKYLLMNRGKLYVPQHRQNAKRTAKRASGFYANDLMRDDVDDIINDGGSVNLSQLDSNTLIQAFVAKILSLQNQIDDLRFKNRLEDLENDELTDALNEATVGQREGTVSSEEWKSLQHAIEIEEALQDLKKKQQSALEVGDIVDQGFDDEDEDEERKRGEPWKRGSVQVEENDPTVYGGVIASRSPAPDRSISNNEIDRLLYSAYQMKDDDSPEGDRESQEGDEDEPIASLFLSNADRCPAIQQYSNNCELADLYSLPVDFEARALCNLHEMCYACGHSLGVSQPQCDLVYRAAVASLCHQKEVCVEESEIFLRSMKLKTRYIPQVQPTCRARCTAQFMGMF